MKKLIGRISTFFYGLRYKPTPKHPSLLDGMEEMGQLKDALEEMRAFVVDEKKNPLFVMKIGEWHEIIPGINIYIPPEPGEEVAPVKFTSIIARGRKGAIVKLHQHEPAETFSPHSGKWLVQYGPDKESLSEIIMTGGQSIHFGPWVWHRVECLEPGEYHVLMTPKLKIE